MPSSARPISHPVEACPGGFRSGTVLAVSCILIGSAAPAGVDDAGDPPPLGLGWTPTHLDLVVTIDREPPSMTVSGTLRVRYTGDPDGSGVRGPSLAVNAYEAPIRWTSLEVPDDATVELDATHPAAEGARLAHVRLATPVDEGHELSLPFALVLDQPAMQLVARDEVALASWIHGWYPLPASGDNVWDRFTAHFASVPGTTVLDLPEGWTGVTDGVRLDRATAGGRTRETWTLGATPVARSFAAGAFREAIEEVDGRILRIALLGEHPVSPDRLASLLGEAMAAAERRLGPFPFAGYGVVEVPDGMEGWYAASQQTFIMAESAAFETDHGNLPLWSHEMCHGWWGNTVSSGGPGDKMVGEALAQLGVLIALEEIEGRAAMIEFLEESRSGYSSRQCARGYVAMVAEGVDHPLATLGESGLSGGQTHHLADSKGMWVWHMLRQRIGDDRFFGTLRGIITDHAGDRITLDDLRAAFVASAPDAGLPAFFAQWLDRPGLPRPSTRVEGTRVVISQPVDDVFVLDLTVEVRRDDGGVSRHDVHVTGAEAVVEVGPGAPITGVELDPDRDLLLWRPEYAPDEPPRSTAAG